VNLHEIKEGLVAAPNGGLVEAQFAD
jgi:hypothetical protein